MCSNTIPSNLRQNECSHYLCVKCIEKEMNIALNATSPFEKIICKCGKAINQLLLSKVNPKLYNQIAEKLNEATIEKYRNEML